MPQTKARSKAKTSRRASSAQKKTTKADTGRFYELYGIILIAFGILLGVCLYTVYGGPILGEGLQYLFYGLFGWPANGLPLFSVACGIYIICKRDYNRLYIKMSLLLLATLNLSVLWSIFSYDGGAASLFDAFQLAAKGIGGGLLGTLIADPLMGVLSFWPSLIIFITTLLILIIFIFKISPSRIIAGFFSAAKREASEIRHEESYEMGKRARKAVDSGLRPLRQRTIDIELDEPPAPAVKKRQRQESPQVPVSAVDADDLPFDFNVPVFDSIAKKIADPIEDMLPAAALTDTPPFAGEVPVEPDAVSPPKEKPVKREKLSTAAETNLRNQLDEGVKNLPLPYKFPPTTLLLRAKNKRNNDSRDELRETAKKLVDTLKSFGVDVKLLQVSRGPTVTRYELQPNVGVKVSKITSLADDIALNLAAPAVRIEAPIPGKAAIGIEIPNSDIAAVALRDVIESDEFQQAGSRLSVAMGMDISGKPVIADIAKMPHVLIAGATGSGKSVCINSIITSILYKADPNEVKIVMIDPKVVELGVYNGIPHLLIPVVTDPKKASGALAWAVSEMVRRYNLFAENGVRDLQGYNELLELQGEEKVPQMVIIIDELADLMMVAPKEVEDSICRLAQMARAAGMHLVIATQRPSVDVITGIIKANIPSRIAFAVSSHIDSRTILDSAGAEKLLGRGDMLYMPMGASKPTRLQGSFVSDKEVERVVEFIKDTSQANYDEDITEKINGGVDMQDAGDADELLPKAIEIALASGQISTSMVQRRLGVGYARAGRIIDQMEVRGIISGADGSKPRNVLVSQEDFE